MSAPSRVEVLLDSVHSSFPHLMGSIERSGHLFGSSSLAFIAYVGNVVSNATLFVKNGTIARPSEWMWEGSIPHDYWVWWWKLVKANPTHVVLETALICFSIYMILYWNNEKKRSKLIDELTPSEKQSLIDTWTPTDLVPPLTSSEVRAVSNSQTITSYTGRHFSTSTHPTLLNFSTFDFLCMSSSSAVKSAALETLNKYGCGSCGPRGFYGTIDCHLDLESHFAKLVSVKSSIMYSDGASTVSSTVAAFAKRGDMLVVDEGVYDSVVTGLTLSRSNVRTFKHNDMQDLRAVLEKVKKEDKRKGTKVTDQRRFIVVEGLYRNYGHICPLDEILALKDEFKFRLIVDDSYSFGVLGSKGLGIADHFGLVGSKVIDITTVSMENAVGSIGGITVGDLEVVDHQRLSGAGYCFSASAPPFVASAAVASLKVLEAQGPALIQTLKSNAEALRKGLSSVPGLEVTSDVGSPIVFCRLSDSALRGLLLNRGGRDEDDAECEALHRIEVLARDGGVAVVATGDHVRGALLLTRPRPMIRLTANVKQDKKDIEKAVAVVRQAVNEVIKGK